MSGAIEKARQAYLSVEEARGDIASARRKLADLDMAHRRDVAELEMLRAEKQCEDAERLLDGEEAVPQNLHRDAQIRSLDANLPAQIAAMELQRRRIADVERAAIKPLTPLAAAVLDLTTQIQNEAVGEVEVALAALAPAFAKLIAVDQIQSATLGKHFPVPAGSVVPFKGFTVVQGTAKGIHERFRSAELEDQALLVAAGAISAPIITQIKGN